MQPISRKARGVIIIIIVLVASPFFVPSFLNLFYKDIAPTEAPDLTLPIVSIPKDQNSYYDLMEASEALDIPENFYSKITLYNESKNKNEWNATLVKKTLSDNKEALAHLATASKKSAYQDPSFADPSTFSFNTILPPFRLFRDLIELNALQATSLAKGGKYREAIDQALQTLRVAEQITESQGTLISYLFSTSLHKTGIMHIQDMVNTTDIPTKDLAYLISSLDDYSSSREDLTRVLKAEFAMTMSTINMLQGDSAAENIRKESLEFGGGLSGGDEAKELLFPSMISGMNKDFYLKPNKTQKYFVDSTRATLVDVNQSCTKLTADYHDDASSAYNNPKNNKLIFLPFTENAIGKELFNLSVYDLRPTLNISCLNNYQTQAVRALAAIKAYKNDTGAYPASLSDVVPKYLASVPIDPYTGGELMYFSDKKIIDSLGMEEDRMNNGNKDGITGPPYTIKIEF